MHHSHVFVELANDFLPLLDSWVLFVIELGLGCSEDKGLLVLHIDAELIIMVGSGTCVRTRPFNLRVSVGEADKLHLIRGQVNGALHDARLVEVVVFDGAFLAQGHVALIVQDDASLAKSAAEEQSLLP